MDRVQVKEDEFDCSPLFNLLWFCYAPAHQFRHLYRHGHVDDCSQRLNAFAKCVKLKLANTPDAKEQWRDLVHSIRERPPTHVWEMREEPPKNWVPYGNVADPPELPEL